MSNQKPKHSGFIYPPSAFSSKAHIKSYEEYLQLYKKSVESPGEFWGDVAQNLHWFKEWNSVFNETSKKWFEGGKTNITYNCLDVHILSWRRNKAAIIWESETGESKTITYQSLFNQVNKLANALKKIGIKKGDKVLIYMGMIPELAVSMLACARIGAIHIVVHSGYNAGALKKRTIDSKAKIIITNDTALKRGSKIFLKKIVDEIISDCPDVKNIVVHKRSPDQPLELNNEKYLLWDELISLSSDECKPAPLNSDDSLFTIYISGQNYPLGVVHSNGGYMVQTYLTSKLLFDFKDEDIFWCTADLGWIAGHTYSLYGALLNGVTTLLYEGTPNYPDNERTWQIISKHKVNIFYTTPTSVRAFRSWGDELLKKYDLSSLRLLAIGGEPISPEIWSWFYKVVGKNKCPVVHTWMQTESGNIFFGPVPGAVPMKAGSCCFPLPGVVPEIVDSQGNPLQSGQKGYLTIKNYPPSILTKIHNNNTALTKYRTKFKDRFFTGDLAMIDNDGYLWIEGRSDKVINVAGHRINLDEIRNILLNHPDIKEAEILTKPDTIKGNALVAQIKLKGKEPSLLLQEELRDYVEKEIGTFAKPDEIKFVKDEKEQN